MNFLLQGLRILCKSLYDDTYSINLPFLSLAMLLVEFTLTFIILFVYHFLTHNNTFRLSNLVYTILEQLISKPRTHALPNGEHFLISCCCYVSLVYQANRTTKAETS